MRKRLPESVALQDPVVPPANDYPRTVTEERYPCALVQDVAWIGCRSADARVGGGVVLEDAHRRLRVEPPFAASRRDDPEGGSGRHGEQVAQVMRLRSMSDSLIIAPSGLKEIRRGGSGRLMSSTMRNGSPSSCPTPAKATSERCRLIAGRREICPKPTTSLRVRRMHPTRSPDRSMYTCATALDLSTDSPSGAHAGAIELALGPDGDQSGPKHRGQPQARHRAHSRRRFLPQSGSGVTVAPLPPALLLLVQNAAADVPYPGRTPGLRSVICANSGARCLGGEDHVLSVGGVDGHLVQTGDAAGRRPSFRV